MNRMQFPALLLLALVACSPAPSPQATATVAGAPAAGDVRSVAHPEWTRRAVIYEVNVRQFTPEGTFAALRQHLPRLKALGVDVLWLMPVQPIGVKNRKGTLGSYYSIANYTGVNPEFGTDADFRALVDDAHAQGLRVILDWVANHTAWDHPWITAHPDWYTHRKDGSISYPVDEAGKETDWTDVADLNYDNAAMRQAMIADMRHWVERMNVDGFRCDVTWGVPMDFWQEAGRQLRALKPDLFMLAESEGAKYHTVFDATYGWELHHLLNEVAKGKAGAAQLDAYFAKDRAAYPADAYRMTFTSNHDENSWQGSEFERMGANHLPAFVLAATVERGIPLIYTGQEASLSKRLRFFEKDTVSWADTSLVGFYRAMIALRHSQAALANGSAGAPQVRLAHSGGERTYAYSRTLGQNTVLVALNFGDAAASLAYSGLAVPGRYTDWFTKAALDLAAAGTLDVPAHGYRVLVR